jgi:hypothetical protein
MTTAEGGNEMESENRHNGDSHEADEQPSPFAMMAGAQERIKAGVGKAADAMPDAMASAQTAARDTQRRLDSMSDDNLLAGASFSLGLAIGLFVSGSSRLLVALTLVPAAAMLSTLMNREREAAANGESSSRRRSNAAKSTSA